MEEVRLPMDLLACPTARRASVMSWLAWEALSAFCFVMEEISSREAEVCSIAAACWEAPSASCWLADETRPDASLTWSAPSMSPSMDLRRDLLMDLDITKPRPVRIKMPHSDTARLT